MGKIFPKINIKFQLTTKLMNRLSYYITTHFITSNKYYNSYCNSHLYIYIKPKLLLAPQFSTSAQHNIKK